MDWASRQDPDVFALRTRWIAHLDWSVRVAHHGGASSHTAALAGVAAEGWET